MKKLVRGGIAVAAVGMLAFGVSACKVSGSGGDSGKGDDKKSASASLGCDDLKKEVNDNAPDSKTPISQFDKDKFAKLTKWMSDNGKDFKKKDLGKAVTEWGDDAGTYFDTQKPMEPKDKTKFEKAAGTIEQNCQGLGFKINKTQP